MGRLDPIWTQWVQLENTVESIRVDEIPGGVWERAPLITPSGDRATATPLSPMVAWVDDGRSWATVAVEPDWHVCLKDSLGLGLAGLTARIGERLGVEFDGPSQLIHYTVVAAGRGGWWVRDFENGSDANRVGSIARYLALTDRLCAAADLALEPGEVARWEFAPPEDHAGEPWLLETSAGCYSYPGPEGKAWAAEDWRPALRAALGGAA